MPALDAVPPSELLLGAESWLHADGATVMVLNVRSNKIATARKQEATSL
jgi:hypothetical protein